MRPLRLDLAGFAVFREPTTIDFTDADFFALVGPTGSGKSTVLDAICFALYGTVPRWGDRRAIANALAPSATEARVRLVFESAGARYVLTRVVRRDGKGAVSTKHAGLEALPAGFDLARFDPDRAPAATGNRGPADQALVEPELGEVLAGTPAELDAAVSAVVGLPYEQFTKCVVLPQGEFAAFLHAKPAERQRILVNLLGLDVYGRIRDRANTVAAAADAKVAVANSLLATLEDASDEAIVTADQRVRTVAGLVAGIDQIMPELAAARAASSAAVADLAALDRELAVLSAHRAPDDASAVTDAVARTRSAVRTATDAITLAEEREEKLRAELATAGDTAVLRGQLDAYAAADRVTAQASELATAIAQAGRKRDLAAAALADARDRAAAARAGLEAARAAYQVAAATDRASALRQHLRVGQPCPVCEHPVGRLPAAPHHPSVSAAEAAGTKARGVADAADEAERRADEVLRAMDLAMARTKAQAEHLAARQADLESVLVDAPEPAALRQRLASISGLTRSCEDASDAVRAARSALRSTSGRAGLAEERLRTAWAAFDTARDTLASFGPPGTDRDDLAQAWGTLTAWAGAQIEARRLAKLAAVDAVDAADRAVRAVGDRIAVLFAAAGVAFPSDRTDPARTAAVALERAEADHRRCVERRAEAQRLSGQRAGSAREALVARALAGHLRADRFERWLLTEALDSLVDGASKILRELSAGQYDLGHDRGEFFVIDHHDAGLRRAVRTLSGGETFQASLALALALSEQLAGASTAAASLESILLDEGFGTLDASTLEGVATTLENLAALGDRVVGVVTHVGALAERIPVRFEVSRDAKTARVERVGL